MSAFHVTLSQGRADTLYLYATSKSKVLNFLNSVSTAIVRSIKEVLFSKDLGINNIGYVALPYLSTTPCYHRVVFYAYSQNFGKTFTLYNVVKPITSTQIRNALVGKIYIKNEPITGCNSFNFYDQATIDTYTDNLYQVQYKKDSKSYVEDIYASSPDYIKNFFSSIIVGEIVEIRKVVHLDATIKKDDGDYVKRLGVYIASDGDSFGVSLPKIKKNLNQTDIKNLIVSNLDFHNGKKIESDYIKLTTR